jgi:hypothetical protein
LQIFKKPKVETISIKQYKTKSKTKIKERQNEQKGFGWDCGRDVLACSHSRANFYFLAPS